MIRIGIITAKNSLNWIKSIEEFGENKCEISYITYQKESEIRDIYLQNYAFFDGIIFSGQLPYFTVKNELVTSKKPVIYLDVTQTDFYKAVCKTMIRERDFNFSRTLIDFLFEKNEYLGLNELLEKEEFPYIFNEDISSYESDTIYEDLFNRHFSLWERGQIDLSFTRASNLSEKLSQNNIRHVVVYPSKEYMRMKLDDLLKQIEHQRLLENQIAIGIISLKILEVIPEMDQELEFRQILLNKALIELKQSENYSFIVQKNPLHYEVITSYKELKSITRDFSVCTLQQFLNSTLPFKVGIGWGFGSTFQEAQINAVEANKKTKGTSESSTYIMTENDHLIGPLGDEACLEILNETDPVIEKLSQQIGISSLQIQKLLAVMDKLNTNELTSDDLAIHLGITIRASNRILKKLEEKEVATVTFQKSKKMKGRPRKLYKINFIN